MEEEGFDSPSDVEGRNKRGKAVGKTSSRPGSGSLLSKRGVQQLLDDIEDGGGLFTVSVKALCNRKPELYGEPNTALRKCVQNQVTRWKRLGTEGYQQLVHGVVVHQRAGTNLSEEIDSQLSADPPFLPNMSSSLVRFGSPPSTSINAPTSIMMSPPGSILSADELYIQEVLMDTSRYVEVYVDVEHPERNREVAVFFFTGAKHQRKLHNGFSIQLEVDPRDASEGRYRAYLLNQDSVFIVAPGQNSSFRLDFSAVIANEGEESCPRIQEAMAVTRNAISNDGKRLNKHILLKFPGYMELSNTIYSPDSKGGKIKASITPYPIKTNLVQDNGYLLKCRIAWNVHVIEAAARVVEDPTAVYKSDEDVMMEKLKVLRFCTDGDRAPSSSITFTSTSRNSSTPSKKAAANAKETEQAFHCQELTAIIAGTTHPHQLLESDVTNKESSLIPARVLSNQRGGKVLNDEEWHLRRAHMMRNLIRSRQNRRKTGKQHLQSDLFGEAPLP